MSAWSSYWTAFISGGVVGWAVGIATMALKELVEAHVARKKNECMAFTADDMECMLHWAGDGAIGREDKGGRS